MTTIPGEKYRCSLCLQEVIVAKEGTWAKQQTYKIAYREVSGPAVMICSLCDSVILSSAASAGTRRTPRNFADTVTMGIRVALSQSIYYY
jgi:hypothetical protein